MASRADSRTVTGNLVHCRASLVTSDAECKRLFGSLWKSTYVTGTVVNLVQEVINGRRRRSVEVDWKIQDRCKRVTLKIVNIKAGTDTSEKDAEENNPISPLLLSFEDDVEQELEMIDLVTEQDANSANANAVVHGRSWSTGPVMTSLNGHVSKQHCSVIGQSGTIFTFGSAPRDLTPFECFTTMFPMKHLEVIKRLTNVKLQERDIRTVTSGELLRFFGLLILLTRFNVSSRRDLWKKTSSKYIPTPDFGRIMSRKRFENILSHICWSDLTEDEDAEMTDSRWSLVSGFLKAINDHREHFVKPSDHLCIDESISRWYGLGGDWIKMGLPHYVAYDRKPENGCELKSMACGASGIMLRLELVMGQTSSEVQEFRDECSHTTALTLRLAKPWLRSGRVVCGDSYFASVQTAEALLKYGTRFIGVVKNATKGFPMEYLARQELTSRGDHVSMQSRIESSDKDLAAVLWMDRERRYFISSCHTTNPGTPISRERWRSVGDSTSKISFQVPVPELVERYYQCCSQVDRHNRCRQDSLGLEKKLEVKTWSLRINSSLLAVTIVDAWLLYKYSHGPRFHMCQSGFYEKLAEELIENSYDSIKRRSWNSSEGSESSSDEDFSAGIGTHLAMTHKKRKLSDGSVSNALYQGRCRSCKRFKSKFQCSTCRDNGLGDIYLCHAGTKRTCFSAHLKQKHDIELM